MRVTAGWPPSNYGFLPWMPLRFQVGSTNRICEFDTECIPGLTHNPEPLYCPSKPARLNPRAKQAFKRMDAKNETFQLPTGTDRCLDLPIGF